MLLSVPSACKSNIINATQVQGHHVYHAYKLASIPLKSPLLYFTTLPLPLSTS